MRGFRSPLLGCLEAPGSVLGPGLVLVHFPPATGTGTARQGFPNGQLGHYGDWALGHFRHLGIPSQALEALVAPPSSSRQAPGQLVAISSVDYLVAMPSGVRALSPAPWDTLLAGMQGFLGLNACKYVSLTACRHACMCVSMCMSDGNSCGSHLCQCGHQCMCCRFAGFSGCIYQQLCPWAHVCVSMCTFVYTRLCMPVCMHIQIPAMLCACILRITQLHLSMSRHIFLWIHLCSHMSLCLFMWRSIMCACVCMNISAHICMTACFWMCVHMCQGEEGHGHISRLCL